MKDINLKKMCNVMEKLAVFLRISCNIQKCIFERAVPKQLRITAVTCLITRCIYSMTRSSCGVQLNDFYGHLTVNHN